jgi:hypothetical protein
MPPQVATETNVGDDIPDDAAPPDAPSLPATEPPPVADGTDPKASDSFVQDTAAVPLATVEGDGAAALVDQEEIPLDDATAESADEVVPPPASGRSVRQRLRARQLRARKVRRTIRHIDPWSVLKFSVFFFALAWMIVIMAGVVLWSIAVNSGLVTDVEDLVTELFDLTSFSIDPNLMFRVSVMVGGAMALGGALFMGVLAVLFNLLSDLLGGIRVSVIEEETARRIVE